MRRFGRDQSIQAVLFRLMEIALEQSFPADSAALRSLKSLFRSESEQHYVNETFGVLCQQPVNKANVLERLNTLSAQLCSAFQMRTPNFSFFERMCEVGGFSVNTFLYNSSKAHADMEEINVQQKHGTAFILYRHFTWNSFLRLPCGHFNLKYEYYQHCRTNLQASAVTCAELSTVEVPCCEGVNLSEAIFQSCMEHESLVPVTLRDEPANAANCCLCGSERQDKLPGQCQTHSLCAICGVINYMTANFDKTPCCRKKLSDFDLLKFRKHVEGQYRLLIALVKHDEKVNNLSQIARLCSECGENYTFDQGKKLCDVCAKKISQSLSRPRRGYSANKEVQRKLCYKCNREYTQSLYENICESCKQSALSAAAIQRTVPNAPQSAAAMQRTVPNAPQSAAAISSLSNAGSLKPALQLKAPINPPKLTDKDRVSRVAPPSLGKPEVPGGDQLSKSSPGVNESEQQAMNLARSRAKPPTPTDKDRASRFVPQSLGKPEVPGVGGKPSKSSPGVNESGQQAMDLACGRANSVEGPQPDSKDAEESDTYEAQPGRPRSMKVQPAHMVRKDHGPGYKEQMAKQAEETKTLPHEEGQSPGKHEGHLQSKQTVTKETGKAGQCKMCLKMMTHEDRPYFCTGECRCQRCAVEALAGNDSTYCKLCDQPLTVVLQTRMKGTWRRCDVCGIALRLAEFVRSAPCAVCWQCVVLVNQKGLLRSKTKGTCRIHPANVFDLDMDLYERKRTENQSIGCCELSSVQGTPLNCGHPVCATHRERLKFCRSCQKPTGQTGSLENAASLVGQ